LVHLFFIFFICSPPVRSSLSFVVSSGCSSSCSSSRFLLIPFSVPLVVITAASSFSLSLTSFNGTFARPGERLVGGTVVFVSVTFSCSSIGFVISSSSSVVVVVGTISSSFFSTLSVTDVSSVFDCSPLIIGVFSIVGFGISSVTDSTTVVGSTSNRRISYNKFILLSNNFFHKSWKIPIHPFKTKNQHQSLNQ